MLQYTRKWKEFGKEEALQMHRLQETNYNGYQPYKVFMIEGKQICIYIFAQLLVAPTEELQAVQRWSTLMSENIQRIKLLLLLRFSAFTVIFFECEWNNLLQFRWFLRMLLSLLTSFSVAASNSWPADSSLAFYCISVVSAWSAHGGGLIALLLSKFFSSLLDLEPSQCRRFLRRIKLLWPSLASCFCCCSAFLPSPSFSFNVSGTICFYLSDFFECSSQFWFFVRGCI